MFTRQANKREENSAKPCSKTLEPEAKNKPAVQTRKGFTSRILPSKPSTSKLQKPTLARSKSVHQHQLTWTGALLVNV